MHNSCRERVLHSMLQNWRGEGAHEDPPFSSGAGDPCASRTTRTWKSFFAQRRALATETPKHVLRLLIPRNRLYVSPWILSPSQNPAESRPYPFFPHKATSLPCTLDRLWLTSTERTTTPSLPGSTGRRQIKPPASSPVY